MKTKIVVDSAANLYALEGVDFACVPLKIITDHEEYRDDGTLDAVGMATTLRTYKGKTSTSCPNVSDWLEAFEEADEVYAITITGTLSGCYNAAQLAAEEYQQEHPGKRVFVLDSLSTGPEQQLLAEHLRDELAAGKDFDALCAEMLRYHEHTHLLFSLESLANLARNGRVKPAVAAVARMLGIRVIGQASAAGELDVICKTQGGARRTGTHRAGTQGARLCRRPGDRLPLRQPRRRRAPQAYDRGGLRGRTGRCEPLRRPVQLLR